MEGRHPGAHFNTDRHSQVSQVQSSSVPSSTRAKDSQDSVLGEAVCSGLRPPNSISLQNKW